jgi:hypothetical protein
VSTEDLIYALTKVLEARQAHDRAFEEYGGYSWGYVGHRLIEDVREAEKTFADKLTTLIDERVQKALDDAACRP